MFGTSTSVPSRAFNAVGQHFSSYLWVAHSQQRDLIYFRRFAGATHDFKDSTETPDFFFDQGGVEVILKENFNNPVSSLKPVINDVDFVSRKFHRSSLSNPRLQRGAA